MNDTVLNQPDVYVDSDNLGGQGKRNLDAENDKSLVYLYPNPSNTEVTLKWKEEFKVSKVKVIDVNGKLMSETEWNKGILNLKISTWPSGIYYVNIESSGKDKIVRKLLINR